MSNVTNYINRELKTGQVKNILGFNLLSPFD